MMTRLRPSVIGRLLAGALAVCGPRAAASTNDPAGIKTFGDWTATCNNVAQCVAAGAKDGELVTVLMTRGAKPMDEPSVKLNLVRTDEDKKPVVAAVIAVIDGNKTTPLEVPKPHVSTEDDRSLVIDLPHGGAGSGFVEATRNADSLTYKIGGTEGSLSLKGMSAALRWIDERQGRVGTTSALVAKGDGLVSRLPVDQAVPEVTAAPAGSAEEVTKPTTTVSLERAMPKGDDCDVDLLHAPEATESLAEWKLGPDRLLVFMPCTRGAYNFGSALFFTDAKGGSPHPVLLPQPAGLRDPGSGAILVNAAFDPATMELTSFDKGRGLGDCGTMTTWVWTGQAFALLDARAQLTCSGLASDDWPNVYRAVKK